MDLTKIDINQRMKHYNIVGLGVTFIDNGQISRTENYGLMEEGTNKKVDSNSVFSACSISKFLTGLLVIKLTEQGLLDLDEDVNYRLKSWKVPDNEFTKNHKVTLRNLLSHQSGIIDPQKSFTELVSENEAPSIIDILNGNSPYCKEPIEVKYKPESDFNYSDAGYCIIQQLIEDVTGKDFEVVIDEQIFKPLNLHKSTFKKTKIGRDKENYSCGHNKNKELVNGIYPIYPYPSASGLWSTSTELALIVIELINSLRGKSNIGISSNKVQEMIGPQGCKEWTGLGVFLDGFDQELEISSLGWGVGFQSILAANPYKGKGLVIMTNTDLGVHQLKGIIGEIYRSYFN